MVLIAPRPTGPGSAARRCCCWCVAGRAPAAASGPPRDLRRRPGRPLAPGMDIYLDCPLLPGIDLDLAVLSHQGWLPGGAGGGSGLAASLAGLSLAYALPIVGVLDGLLTYSSETEQVRQQ